LTEVWNRADDDGNGKLQENEVFNLLRSLNINIRHKDCKKLFDEFDIDKSGFFDFTEFSKFVEKLKQRLV
jgi:Ca2+-binding EF-hand superfamily protein